VSSQGAEGGSPVSLRGGSEATDEAISISYYHSDHLGSSNVISDANGVRIAAYEYQPYGKVSKLWGEDVTDYKFTGKELDDTGLYYYGARYYDPEIGRFTQADTMIPYPLDSQSFNRYSYCVNNPLKYVDPSGHMHDIPDFQIPEDIVENYSNIPEEIEDFKEALRDAFDPPEYYSDPVFSEGDGSKSPYNNNSMFDMESSSNSWIQEMFGIPAVFPSSPFESLPFDVYNVKSLYDGGRTIDKLGEQALRKWSVYYLETVLETAEYDPYFFREFAYEARNENIIPLDPVRSPRGEVARFFRTIRKWTNTLDDLEADKMEVMKDTFRKFDKDPGGYRGYLHRKYLRHIR
jgi:RHS repeat-associated protein